MTRANVSQRKLTSIHKLANLSQLLSESIPFIRQIRVKNKIIFANLLLHEVRSEIDEDINRKSMIQQRIQMNSQMTADPKRIDASCQSQSLQQQVEEIKIVIHQPHSKMEKEIEIGEECESNEEQSISSKSEEEYQIVQQTIAKYESLLQQINTQIHDAKKKHQLEIKNKNNQIQTLTTGQTKIANENAKLAKEIKRLEKQLKVKDAINLRKQMQKANQ